MTERLLKDYYSSSRGSLTEQRILDELQTYNVYPPSRSLNPNFVGSIKKISRCGSCLEYYPECVMTCFHVYCNVNNLSSYFITHHHHHP